MNDLNEDFYAVLEWYAEEVVPLELWETNDLIDLFDVLREELEARERRDQIEYFENQNYGGTD